MEYSLGIPLDNTIDQEIVLRVRDACSTCQWIEAALVAIVLVGSLYAGALCYYKASLRENFVDHEAYATMARVDRLFYV